MYPVSAAFSAAITMSHRLGLLVEVMVGGTVVDTLDTVTAGSVTLDAKAQSRGRLDLTVVDDGSLGLIPTTPAAQLAPYGTELRVSRGIQYPDGTQELVPLGVYRIDDTDVTDTAGALAVQVSGLDRSARIIDARFEAPYQVAAGTNVATAILTIVQAGYTDVVTNFTPTSATTPLVIAAEGDDRWQLAQDLATAAGLRLYFDGRGTLVLDPQSPGAAVITLAEGINGVLITAGRKWSRQGAYNRWIVTGENTGNAAPVRGVATDTNPLSPTVYGGPFGQVPKFFQSQFVVTTQQAQDAADAMKTRELGTTQSVDFGTTVLPHLEPGDVALITRLRAGINENHILDRLTIPLTADQPMSGQTRALPVTGIGVDAGALFASTSLIDTTSLVSGGLA